MQRGFQRDDSVVTVHSVTDFVQVMEFAHEPEIILSTIADRARQRGINRDDWCGDDRGLVVVIGLEQQQRLVAAGWNRQQVQEFLWPRLAAPSTGRYDRKVDLAGPGNILLVAAGGPGIAVSWLLMPHLSNPISQRIE